MNSSALILIAIVLSLAMGCTGRGEKAGDQYGTTSERTLVGQVLLPPGEGRRGLELHVEMQSPDESAIDQWILFDAQGHFEHFFQGRLTGVAIRTGGAELFRVEAEKLAQASQPEQLDVGVIDLRDRLLRHRLALSAIKGKPLGLVRVAMWLRPPPVGPQGEPVSLGSRQFPPVELGSTMEWLVPAEAQSIYFLVERPADEKRGRHWRSGHQQLFGPYSSSELPTEIFLD